MRRSDGAVAVERGHVERADPEVPGVADRRDRCRVVDRPRTARRSMPRRAPSRVTASPVRPSATRSVGLERHDSPYPPRRPLWLTRVQSASVSSSPRSTGQNTEHSGATVRLLSCRSADSRERWASSMPTAGFPPFGRPGWSGHDRRPCSVPGATSLDELRAAASRARIAERGRPLAETELLAPVPRPGKIVAIGRNYREHAAEEGVEPPAAPADLREVAELGRSARARTSGGIPGLTARSTTRRSSLSSSAGRRVGWRLTPRSITCSGYTCLNDVSARDLQFGDGQWIRGKSLDTFCPMGPSSGHGRRDRRSAGAGDPLPGRRRGRPGRQHRADVLLASRRSSATARRHSRSSPATSSRPARRQASASSATRPASSGTGRASSSRSMASAGSRTPAGSTAARRPRDRAGRAQRAVPRHRRARLHRRVDRPNAGP